MISPELLDALSFHADALNQGQDMTDALASRYALIAPEAAPFFYLARELQKALVPVTTPVTLRTGLRARLVGKLEDRWRKHTWMALAAAGSLLSLAGLTVLLKRRFQPAA